MAPIDILLYSQIIVLLRHHQRSFLLQQMGRTTETHSLTVNRMREKPENTQAYKGCLHQIPSSGALGILLKRRQKECKNQRKEGTKKRRSALLAIRHFHSHALRNLSSSSHQDEHCHYGHHECALSPRSCVIYPYKKQEPFLPTVFSFCFPSAVASPPAQKSLTWDLLHGVTLWNPLTLTHQGSFCY